MPNTALISVSNRAGITDFASTLQELGICILATSGTADHLQQADIEVTKVSAWTGSAELLDGRVKTLHPSVHAAILADRDDPHHMEQLERRGIDTIDLVVCNLYSLDDGDAEIDIGGHTLLRSAAKNCDHVTVIVDPADYRPVAEALERRDISRQLRRQLAHRAFRHIAEYDAAVLARFKPHRALPEEHFLSLHRQQGLRYGENPHQQAALYVDATQSPSPIRQLHGKQLSYNNLVDLDAALQLVQEFDQPAAAIIKHTNPAGCAANAELYEAFLRAHAGDPMSAFGGIVALNRMVDRRLADELQGHFLEVIAAPDFSDSALEVLKQKKRVRLIQWSALDLPARQIRSTALGWLVQTPDPPIELDLSTCEIPTGRPPDDEELKDLDFAWRVVKHVKSNAIVLAKDGQIIGVGAGQMSRVDAVGIAVENCVASTPEGSVMASDAFFPFRDGIDTAAQAGIRAVIQPGGSRRDAEVVEACNEAGIAMVMTGERHFRHG